MGLVWNVVHPLSMIVIYSVIFTTLYNARLADVQGRFSYTFYLCAGFFPWMAFSECVARGSVAFSSNAAYLKRLPVPEQIFVAQTAGSATLGLAINFCLLLVVSMALGMHPNWGWLLLPLPLILLQIAGFGLGLTCGTLNVFFPDVAQLVGVALQVAFWMTPIVYLSSTAPAWMRPVLAVHPATPAIAAVRQLFLYGQLPSLWMWAGMAIWAGAAMVVGALVLRALRPEIRDLL
jgi:ABC-type polysaccharide/polyol phosphate export permease